MSQSYSKELRSLEEELNISSAVRLGTVFASFRALYNSLYTIGTQMNWLNKYFLLGWSAYQF